jgi:CBS domain-containing protein
MEIKTILNKDGRGPTTIESSTTVGEAIWKLQQAGTGALIVSDDGHEILGLVSGHDLIRAFRSHGVDPLMPMTAADIMRPNILTCRPDDGLRRVMTRMSARGLGHIAVVDDSGPCGVVSLADIIKARLHWAKAEVEALCTGVAQPV